MKLIFLESVKFSKKNNSKLITTGFGLAQGSHQVISELSFIREII